MRHVLASPAPLALRTVLLARRLRQHRTASRREAQPRDADTLTLATTQPSPRTRPTPQFPAQDWWTALGDPQLDALIDEALAGTPSLDAADARMRQAAAQAGLADAARKPTLGASAQYSACRCPKRIAPDGLGGELPGQHLLMLNFKYEPRPVGRARARSGSGALGQARAAEVDAQAARLTLASNIARTYVALAQAHDALDVADARSTRARRTCVGLGQQRVKAGLDNQLQLRRPKAPSPAREQQAQAAQQQIDMRAQRTRRTAGQGPGSRPVRSRARACCRRRTPGVPVVLPSELLGHRPDVVAARWRVEAAGEGIDASKAAFYPTRQPQRDRRPGLGQSVAICSAAMRCSVNGGPAHQPADLRRRPPAQPTCEASDADYDLAVANYNQTLVGAVREVADAVQAARSLDAQIDDARAGARLPRSPRGPGRHAALPAPAWARSSTCSPRSARCCSSTSRSPRCARSACTPPIDLRPRARRRPAVAHPIALDTANATAKH